MSFQIEPKRTRYPQEYFLDEKPKLIKCMEAFGDIRTALGMENYTEEEDVAKKVSYLAKNNSHLQSALNFCLKNTNVRSIFYWTLSEKESLSDEDKRAIKIIPPHYMFFKDVESGSFDFVKEMCAEWSPPLKIFFTRE